MTSPYTPKQEADSRNVIDARLAPRSSPRTQPDTPISELLYSLYSVYREHVELLRDLGIRAPDNDKYPKLSAGRYVLPGLVLNAINRTEVS